MRSECYLMDKTVNKSINSAMLMENLKRRVAIILWRSAATASPSAWTTSVVGSCEPHEVLGSLRTWESAAQTQVQSTFWTATGNTLQQLAGFFSSPRDAFLQISGVYGNSMLTWNLILVLPPCRFITDVSTILTVSVHIVERLFCGQILQNPRNSHWTITWPWRWT